MIDKHAIPTKLLWVDLEMTGLDPVKDVILEVAAKVTDFEFNTLDSYEAFIGQPEDVLATMNDWSREHHTANGLLESVRSEGRPEREVVQGIVNLTKSQFGNEPAILAGNSIHQDRKFIARWWPEVEALLHYRMLDVTTLKVLMQGRYGLEYEKSEAHRALGDIEESIEELQYYLELLHRRPGA